MLNDISNLICIFCCYQKWYKISLAAGVSQ